MVEGKKRPNVANIGCTICMYDMDCFFASSIGSHSPSQLSNLSVTLVNRLPLSLPVMPLDNAIHTAPVIPKGHKNGNIKKSSDSNVKVNNTIHILSIYTFFLIKPLLLSRMPITYPTY